MEKYLTHSLGKYLIFKDSLQFLASSLATLAKYLEKTGLESFFRLRKRFHGFESDDIRLLAQKGVYPYDYMDMWEKKDAAETTQGGILHKADHTDISDEDYEQALKVFVSFMCGTMRI